MPVPTAITDLSTTAAINFPAGSDSPSSLDDVQRAQGAFIAQIRDAVGMATGALVPATARATLGSTTVGDAVFVAANAATARTALGALGASDTIASATTAGALNAASTLPNLTLATTQTLTDSSTRVCTTAFAQGISLGSGQTWQDLTGTRAFNTTYTNSSARTITVATTTATVGNFDITAVVGGVSISQSAGVFTTVADRGTLLFHVPPSATYRVNSTVALAIWAELI